MYARKACDPLAVPSASFLFLYSLTDFPRLALNLQSFCLSLPSRCNKRFVSKDLAEFHAISDRRKSLSLILYKVKKPFSVRSGLLVVLSSSCSDLLETCSGRQESAAWLEKSM